MWSRENTSTSVNIEQKNSSPSHLHNFLITPTIFKITLATRSIPSSHKNINEQRLKNRAMNSNKFSAIPTVLLLHQPHKTHYQSPLHTGASVETPRLPV